MSNYRYCLSIGSNLGDKSLNIRNALKFLNLRPHKLIKTSGIYSSSAWGYESANDFLNCCVEIESELPPFELLNHIKMYELSLGRIKGENKTYNDRVIDIDILLAKNDIICAENLVIPHPLMHKRNFVLVPLNEIVPDMKHPLLNYTVAELLIHSPDKSEVNLTTNEI